MAELPESQEERKLETVDDLRKEYLPLTEEPHNRKAGDCLFAISKTWLDNFLAFLERFFFLHPPPPHATPPYTHVPSTHTGKIKKTFPFTSSLLSTTIICKVNISKTMYCKVYGTVRSTNCTDPNNPLQLRKDIKEHRDFEWIPSEQWKLLHK